MEAIKNYLQMFTTTFGTACVISAVTMLFYSWKARSEFHKKNKLAHAFVLALFFGLLSAYATVSAVPVEVNGSSALCNCRNLAPLYAGLVGGPIAGVGAGIIGGLFRFFVYGGTASDLPCMIACIAAGCIGTVFHLLVKKNVRYSIPVGIIASIITEGLHMLLLVAFDLSATAKVISLPIILANVFGMIFCLYMYKKTHPENEN